MINKKHADELERIAKELAHGTDKEKAVASILNGVLGATYMGDEILLCNKVHEFVKDVLMPTCQQEIENKKANLN